MQRPGNPGPLSSDYNRILTLFITYSYLLILCNFTTLFFYDEIPTNTIQIIYAEPSALRKKDEAR